MKDCFDCSLEKKRNKWDDCNGHDWYSYREIISYCPFQVIWLIENTPHLLCGKWPPRVRTIEPNVLQRPQSSEASFVKPRTVLADIYSRLARTKKDGLKLIKYINNGGLIDYDAREALHFITGKRAKSSKYTLWKAKRQYRAKNRLTQSKYRRLKAVPILKQVSAMARRDRKLCKLEVISSRPDDTYFITCVNCGEVVLISKKGDKCYWCNKSATEKEQKYTPK